MSNVECSSYSTTVRFGHISLYLFINVFLCHKAEVMVKFIFTGGVLHDLMKTKCLHVGRCKWKDNINKIFPRYYVSNSLPFSAYHDQILRTPNGYITNGLILLNKMIKVVPDLRRFVFKPVCQGS